MSGKKVAPKKRRKNKPKHLSHTISVSNALATDAGVNLTQKIKLNLKFSYEDWLNSAEFEITYRFDLSKLNELQQIRYIDKRDATIAKWTLVHIAGAELCSLCDWICENYNALIPTPIQKYLTLKFESFLTISRSFLDILASALSLVLLSNQIQSFNEFRKNKKVPDWLNKYTAEEMISGASISLADTGWLSLLISSDAAQCLRDFVTHRGVANFCFSEADEKYELVIKPPRGAGYLFPVKKIVEKILMGLTSLNRTLVENMQDKLIPISEGTVNKGA